MDYEPSLYHTGGVYRLWLGTEHFYIGSGGKLGSRNSDHLARLEKGEHPNPRLQEAFNHGKEYRFEILRLLPKKPRESDADYKKRRLMWEQVALDEMFKDIRCANRSSNSGYNTGISGWLKAKWQEPEFRDAQVARLRSRKVSTETRRKHSESKKGALNGKARGCRIAFGGETFDFPTGTAAARHFGVSQQAMQLWLSGKEPWPGSGTRLPRPACRHLIGITGSYL